MLFAPSLMFVSHDDKKKKVIWRVRNSKFVAILWSFFGACSDMKHYEPYS